jgi:hypothetical protein
MNRKEAELVYSSAIGHYGQNTETLRFTKFRCYAILLQRNAYLQFGLSPERELAHPKFLSNKNESVRTKAEEDAVSPISPCARSGVHIV